MRGRKGLSCIGLVAALAVAGCGGEDASADATAELPLRFDTARVRLVSGADTVPIRVELAVTDEQRAFGLMVRPSLPPDAGMLFLYDSTQPADAGFWMYRTRMPLDIAFLDSAGIIRAIRSMAPCDSTFPQACPSYPAGVPYRAALEVNQGFFTRRGLTVGDRVLLEDVGPRR
jgi:uncharacterized membrane protein (UPF0127 family)